MIRNLWLRLYSIRTTPHESAISALILEGRRGYSLPNTAVIANLRVRKKEYEVVNRFICGYWGKV